jgi:hypothetical protein
LTAVARTILISAGLQRKFWPLAIQHAAFLRNRLPTSGNAGDISPYEAFTGTIPDLQNLPEFGAKCVVIEEVPRGRKFDARTSDRRFVGYEPGYLGFRCLDPKSYKLTVSREVTFKSSDLQSPAKVATHTMGR